MADLPTTSERILEASRRLFNARGYASTSLADIAAEVGISKGNLTYHFPTKYELVVECIRRNRKQRREQFELPRPASLVAEYVDIVRVAMEQAREWRFLIRDRAQFQTGDPTRRADAAAAAEIEHLTWFLRQFQAKGMLRASPGIDLEALARSAWMVSRFWIDHLAQDEGLDDMTWEDQKRGMRHHFAVLMPALTAPARREFESVLARLELQHGIRAA